MINVCDLDMVNELYITKNKYFDKSPKQYNIFNFLVGEALIFLPSNSHWSQRRHTLSSHFYKDKLIKMLHLVMEITQSRVQKWKRECVGQSNATINIMSEISKLMADSV